MPFPPSDISDALRRELEYFVRNHDFVEFYRGYHWGNDTWHAGFPDILRIEMEFNESMKHAVLKRESILAVARWGKLRNTRRIRCPEEFGLELCRDGLPDQRIARDPLGPLLALKMKVGGLGPTYLTKVLRFALPAEYGSIDTRIVRVLGVGDPNSRKHAWLRLAVRNYGYGWFIPETQSEWPSSYARWIDILRFFARYLNDSGLACPHPEAYLKKQLRKPAIWVCADIEMALFSYCSRNLAKDHLGPSNPVERCLHTRLAPAGSC